MSVSALADAFAGSLGGCLSALVFYPIDVAKTHVMVSKGEHAAARRVLRSRTLATFLRILRYDGVGGLFRGVGMKATNAFVSGFIYFYAYTFLKNAIKRRSGGKVSAPLSLLTAALAGAINMSLTIPLDNVCTRLQTQGTIPPTPCSSKNVTSRRVSFKDSSENIPECKKDTEKCIDVNSEKDHIEESRPAGVMGKSENVIIDCTGESSETDVPSTEERNSSVLEDAWKDCCRVEEEEQQDVSAPWVSAITQLYNEGGLKRFWRGLIPALILTCNPAINYTAFDILKALYLRRHPSRGSKLHPSTQLGPLAAFVIAAGAKVAATVLTYPLIRAKTMMMAKQSDMNDISAINREQGKRRGSDMISVLVNVASTEGLHGLYAGCGGQLMHGVLKSALLLTAREEIAAASEIFVQSLFHTRPALLPVHRINEKN